VKGSRIAVADGSKVYLSKGTPSSAPFLPLIECGEEITALAWAEYSCSLILAVADKTPEVRFFQVDEDISW